MTRKRKIILGTAGVVLALAGVGAVAGDPSETAGPSSSPQAVVETAEPTGGASSTQVTKTPEPTLAITPRPTVEPTPAPTVAPVMGEGAEKYLAFLDHVSVSTNSIAMAMDVLSQRPTQTNFDAAGDLLVEEMDWLSDNFPVDCYTDVWTEYYGGISSFTMALIAAGDADMSAFETHVNDGMASISNTIDAMQSDPTRCVLE